MKIEILETLALSYLKHILGCRIVEINWKLSGKWFDLNNVENDSNIKEAKNLFENLKKKRKIKACF